MKEKSTSVVLDFPTAGFLSGRDELKKPGINTNIALKMGPDNGKGKMMAKTWQHAANEWADAATNGLQWMRNVRDGISTPEEAIVALQSGIEHARNEQPDHAIDVAAVRPWTKQGNGPSVDIDFDEIHFRPAWRSQLGRLITIALGIVIFLFADLLPGLLQIDRLLLLLQHQGFISSASTLNGYIATGLAFIGLGSAGVAVLGAGLFIYSHRYFIGPRGIEENEGLVSKDQNRIEFKHIRGVNLRQTVFERLLGIGTIDVATSGGENAEVRFVGIANPKRILNILRERLKALA